MIKKQTNSRLFVLWTSLYINFNIRAKLYALTLHDSTKDAIYFNYAYKNLCQEKFFWNCATVIGLGQTLILSICLYFRSHCRLSSLLSGTIS